MSTIGGFGGGGGGFGAFPYRSPHQQDNGGGRGRQQGRGGQEGRGDNGGRGGRGGYRRRKPPSLAGRNIQYEAEIYVPVNRRGWLVGTGGSIIKELCDVTKTRIDVPGKRNNNPLHPVRVKGVEIIHVLFACWKISKIILKDEINTVACSVNFREPNVPPRRGLIRVCNKYDSFMIEEINDGISVYCIEYSNISNDNVNILIDNELFVDPDINAFCDTLPLSNEVYEHGVIIIFGNPTQKPEKLVEALAKAETETF